MKRLALPPTARPAAWAFIPAGADARGYGGLQGGYGGYGRDGYGRGYGYGYYGARLAQEA